MLTQQPIAVWEGSGRAFIPSTPNSLPEDLLHVGKAGLGSKKVPLRSEPVLSYSWGSEPLLGKAAHCLVWVKRPEQTSMHGSWD